MIINLKFKGDKSSQRATSNRRRTVQGIPDEFPSINFDQEGQLEGKEMMEEGDQQQEDIEGQNEGHNEDEKEGEYEGENEGEHEGENENEGRIEGENYEENEGENEEGNEVEQRFDEEEPLVENLEEYQQNEDSNLNEEPVQMETSKNIIKEVPKSEESSEYDKPHYGSKGISEKKKSSAKFNEKKNENKENYDKKMQRDKSKKNLVEDLHSQKEIHKKLIGESLFQSKTAKILQKDSNIPHEMMKIKKQTGKIQNKSKGSEEEKIKEVLENSVHTEIQESQKSKHSVGSKKNSKEMMDQNTEFLKFNENMYEILADNIEKIRESLKNMKKTNLSEEDQKVLFIKDLYIL